MWPFRKKAPDSPIALSLEEAAQHAGFFAAHAIWSVAEGETLIPMLVHAGPGNKPSMTRLVSDDAQKTVAEARARLDEDARRHGSAILLYDTFLTLGDWRTDAIVVETIAGSSRFVMGVPYRNAISQEGFAVYKPKFLEGPRELVQQLGQRFFAGVGSHEKGNAVWSKFIDQTR